MSNDNDDRLYEQQAAIFERLYHRIEDALERFGHPHTFQDPGDFSVYDGYLNHPQVKVTVSDLNMLRPVVVIELQRIVKEFCGWEIVVAVAVRGHYDDWPDMGLIVRSHEIIDGLQRQYFPPEFQDIRYEGSRPGTDRDWMQSDLILRV